MSLVKYNNRHADVLPTAFNSLVDRFFSDVEFDNVAMNRFNPSVDILESDKAFEIHIAVPGFEKDSFDIAIEDKQLIVSGERKFEEEKCLGRGL